MTELLIRARAESTTNIHYPYLDCPYRGMISNVLLINHTVQCAEQFYNVNNNNDEEGINE